MVAALALAAWVSLPGGDRQPAMHQVSAVAAPTPQTQPVDNGSASTELACAPQPSGAPPAPPGPQTTTITLPDGTTIQLTVNGTTGSITVTGPGKPSTTHKLTGLKASAAADGTITVTGKKGFIPVTIKIGPKKVNVAPGANEWKINEDQFNQLKKFLEDAGLLPPACPPPPSGALP